jgi:hypothetical protein
MTEAADTLLTQPFSGRTLEPGKNASLPTGFWTDTHGDHTQTNSSSTAPSVAPTIAPGNHTNHTSTPAPSIHPTTPAPSTLAPTTALPTPTPKPYVAPTEPPTHAPTLAPTKEPQSGGGVSFFRMIGKMLAWCILMGLGVLLYGFCIQHKYQIAYYLRHFWHCLQAVNSWLIQKIRPDASHNLHRGYAAMFAQERNDAQSLLFDNPNGTMYEGGGGVPDATSDGFVMGQHSGMNFHSMG